MRSDSRLTIAIQKSGRLNNAAIDLLSRCGLKMDPKSNALLCHIENLNIDILLIRDDDIPIFVMDDVCDVGIVGENVVYEQLSGIKTSQATSIEIIKKLGFGRCRLSIAVPEQIAYQGSRTLQNSKIATSYPNLLEAYLSDCQIKAEIISISGSVEIAPSLKMADAICDLVSSGRTLEENRLKEVETLLHSQAVLIKKAKPLTSEKQKTLDLLLRRMDGVLKAQECKYIMFHAPEIALPEIQKIFPGCETPTVMPLQGMGDKVAVHVVSGEAVFWNTLEDLKRAGASSILVLPIEKIMD